MSNFIPERKHVYTIWRILSSYDLVLESIHEYSSDILSVIELISNTNFSFKSAFLNLLFWIMDYGCPKENS